MGPWVKSTQSRPIASTSKILRVSVTRSVSSWVSIELADDTLQVSSSTSPPSLEASLSIWAFTM